MFVVVVVVAVAAVVVVGNGRDLEEEAKDDQLEEYVRDKG